MMETQSIIAIYIAVVSLITQLAAAYYSYVIYTYHRLSKGWLAVSVALLVLAFRSVTSLLLVFGLFEGDGLLEALDLLVLPILIGGLLLVGVWSMKKNFDLFEVVEKKTKEKAKTFDKRRKGK
jgi:hypothetical protein